jgi:hypothetical protein
MNSGLKSIQEDNLIDGVNYKNVKFDYSNQLNAQKSDYQSEDIYYPYKNLNCDLRQEEENLHFGKDEKKFSGNNFYKHRASGSQNSIDFSKKSVSYSGKLTDDENYYEQ